LDVITAIVRHAVKEVGDHWTENQKEYPRVGRTFRKLKSERNGMCSERAKEWLRKMYTVQGLI